eukprot:909618-Rhodomonas_salina.7
MSTFELGACKGNTGPPWSIRQRTKNFLLEEGASNEGEGARGWKTSGRKGGGRERKPEAESPVYVVATRLEDLLERRFRKQVADIWGEVQVFELGLDDVWSGKGWIWTLCEAS